MTSNRFVAGTPKAVVTSAPIEPKFSPLCEVPGCMTLYLGKDSGDKAHYACGKTAVLVNDWRGEKRGICAEHYLRGLVRAGKSAQQDLVNDDGSISLDKFRAMQQRLRDEGLDYIPHDRRAQP